MKVEVKEMPEFRADLTRLLERRSRQRLDALAMAEVYLYDIRDRMTRHLGPPPGDETRPRVRGQMWWRYVRGVWVGYRRSVEYRGIIRRKTLVITLAAVEPFPPGESPALA